MTLPSASVYTVSTSPFDSSPCELEESSEPVRREEDFEEFDESEPPSEVTVNSELRFV